MYLIRVGASFALILCLGCLVSLANDQPQAASATKPTKQPYFWIFLTSGKSTANVDRVEIEKMQAAHLSNFGRLHGEGKLFMAGPLSDPEKNLGPSGISVGNGGEKQPPLKEQHDILNEFVGAPGSDRPPHMELPTENPDGPC
jgi:hypothetical protein